MLNKIWVRVQVRVWVLSMGLHYIINGTGLYWIIDREKENIFNFSFITVPTDGLVPVDSLHSWKMLPHYNIFTII